MPLIHGVGMECGRSDPVFMAKFGLQPVVGHHPEFPYDPLARDKLISEGDSKALEESKLGNAWLAEVCSGQFHSWDDLKLIRDNWDGPIVLKGIQRRSVCLSIRGEILADRVDRTRRRLLNLELTA